MTSCYSAKRPLVESEATLFSGSSPILVVALKWLSVETLELLGSWSNVEFRRVQSWVLSFTCYIQPTFQPYSSNTPHVVTSMLMMCRRSSMVHFLISSLLLTALMLSQDLHLWMSSNRLSLNPNKTQFIWFGTPQQLSKLDLPPAHRKISLLCLSFQCSKPWRSPGQHPYLLRTCC